MRERVEYRRLLALFLVPAAALGQIAGQPSRRSILPAPAGKYAIGRQAYDWTDSARTDQFSSGPSKHRELMVYIWYPAQASTLKTSAPYFPKADQLDKNPAAQSAARDIFGLAWPQIAAGSLRSHAVTNAPPLKMGGQFPVILFSHGYSATTFSYTAQIENFVSHGYVVVAIEHTDAAGLVLFPDGRIRLFRNPPVSPSIHDPLKAMIASAEEGTQIGAEDLRFVLDMLAKQKSSVTRMMDLGRVAAVGHSYGGTLSARACQIDAQIKACISEDGEVNPVGAFFDFSDRLPLDQPFMLIEIANHPTASELARMGESQSQWNDFLEHQHQQLEACGAGSYHVLLSGSGMAHSSFSDGPVLNAPPGSAQSTVALQDLLLTEDLEMNFLDENLKGNPAPLLDGTAKVPSEVQVERVGRLH